MKISNRHRRTYSLAVFCALASVFLILYGCGDDDDGGGVPVTKPYIISGQVTSNGPGLSGVTMTLSGASSATTATDNTGNYTFALDNGSYTITPSKTGFTFNPTSSPQTVSGANITAVNFIATSVQLGTYSISGQVISPATFSGLSGVTMTLSGASFDNVITDASGNYTFTGLDNGSYTITLSATGHTFDRTSSTQTVNGANITGVNFTVTSTQGPQVVTCPLSGATNVVIQDFSFTPQNVTISANGIVKWTNNGPSIHTVARTGWADLFISGNLETGASFCVQFFATGTYPYLCSLHPMTGVVTVQ